MSANTKRALFAGLALLALLVAGLLIAQAFGGNDDPIAIDSPTPSPPAAEETPSPSTPEEAVEQAYLHQWEVYAQAALTLDPTGLEEVVTDEALEVVQEEIERRRRTETPSRVRVEHDYEIRIVNATTAVVDDRYINRSVTIDPETGEPTEPDPNQIVHEVYTMKLVDGAWKVSAIVRQSVRPRRD